MNQIQNCPLCGHQKFKPVLSAVDYTVSKDTFNIVACEQCKFQFTNPIPEEDKIGAFYKSESYVSHSSTNKGLINKIYQRVRKHTLKTKSDLVLNVANGKEVLDIGAGTGHFLNQVNHVGLHGKGLEPDEDARAFAKSNFNLDLAPIEKLHELEAGSIDVITMWHVLEHVYHLQNDFTQMVKLLNQNGKLIIAVPNRNSYDAKIYKAYWAAYDLPIHLYHFTPTDIKALAKQHGMKVEQILPMKFDAYYVSMLSEKYKGGNVFKAFFNGWISNMKAKNDSYSSQIYILSKES
ncbi:hypothetical protein DNU06_11890 [Putridiphycobacter roseus]|uniref:Methyltransferase n=1 Tax=Putridiphycobacter roseus TaxID=2219161 RepID=A0A2W1N0R3_9FLAO|nr:class I SAM-dependent methyltransferase [Putridiphycobacter roseus]PZE16551.1 hypothetical protein DNU06_11890 [Putridiphycobacter roseus]